VTFSSTGSKKIAAHKCCVVFESVSGKIVHVYRLVTMEGAEERSDKAITERALALAKKHGASASKLSVIHIDPKLLESREQLHVDVKKLELKSSKPRAAAKKKKAKA
jgi:hypothetical protein